MLTIGSRDALRVRREDFDWGAGVRLLYASDLHLTRWTTHVVEQLERACRETLGGDLADLPNGLPLLAEFVSAQTCLVWAIGGNHDELLGLHKTRRCIESAGGIWLESEIHIGQHLTISGKLTPIQHPNAILCAHDPVIFPAAVQAGYRLVLAGHLHGGQCVLMERNSRTYPGAFISRWNGDRFTCGRSVMLVSKGVNDLLPIRWNCPREVILCCC
jgi:uncharacterized protein